MNLIQENNTQEKQNYTNMHAVNDPYEESKIPSFNEKDIKFFYEQISNLNKAIEEGNKEYVIEYFDAYSEIIQKAVFDSNESYEYIEFLLPYIDGILQVDTKEDILGPVIKSVYSITKNSLYYSKQFVESPAYKQLIAITEENISDYITCVAFNIICELSNYPELHDTYKSCPIQALFECLLSDNYKQNSKDGIIHIINLYLLDEKDDQNVSEIFASIFKVLKVFRESKKNIDAFLVLLSIVARFIYKNEINSTDFLPEEMKDLISESFYDIARYSDPVIENDLFYLIKLLTENGFQIKYQVEELYQLILQKENPLRDRTKEMLITSFSRSIHVSDDIEYSKIFITKSIENVISYFFEYGTVNSKKACIILFGTILVTDNFDLFISILNNSHAFSDFLNFIENCEDEKTVIFGIGILGNAFQYLKTRMPNSDELRNFVSILCSSDLSERLNQIAETSNDSLIQILTAFYALIKNEESNMAC